MQNLMPPINTPDQLFHDGDPTQGIEGTLVTAGYLNNQQGATRDLQQELLNVLGGAHIQPDPKKTDQLLTALRALLLSRKNPFGDIKLDGTVQKALENLGLGEGSALPVGVPVPWPSATPPTGWLKCNGAAFSAEEYPELAKAYPTNKLPDLRGEFIRGWDDGRGVDVGRAILSSQGDAIRNIIGKFGNTQLYPSIYCDGAFGVTVENVSQTLGLTLAPSGTGNGTVNFSFDASKIVPVATENRPRNVAFNFIVRAA
ncbi:putative tail fiber/collar phage protein [Escherichia coli]|uniref:phage tail protein n=1 Tax=Escherichia coli TaxID=562 RepID=UPI000E060F1C|nr:phage tail protein [Escherichia coli]STG43217.1 putative tail fiber/collar phage protein [Escherichia coli]